MIAGVVANQIVQQLGQVATPTINVYCYINGMAGDLYYSAKNNDVEAVLMYTEVNDTTPDIPRGTVPSGNWTSYAITSITGNVTVYAQAKVSGRTDSVVASQYFNFGFCQLL